MARMSDSRSCAAGPAAPDLRELKIVRRPDQVAALVDPVRRRLVDALAERPDSAVGLARRLDDTRQRLNYHLRQLEEAGVVELAEERPRRGAKERIYRPVAAHFVIDPTALGTLAPEAAESGDRSSATWLVALAARAVRELAALMHRARVGGKRLPTVGMSAEVRLAEPDDFEAFTADLAEAVGAVVARYHTERGDGRGFRVMAGSWPAPAASTNEDEEDTA